MRENAILGPNVSTGRTARWNALSGVDRRNRCAGIGLLSSLILYAFFVDPEKVTLYHCFFREWTGMNCFTCGLSHSLHASACLDWTAAVQFHLFGPLLFISAWLVSFYWIAEILLDRKGMIRIKAGKVRFGILLLAVAWVVYWLLHLSPASHGPGA